MHAMRVHAILTPAACATRHTRLARSAPKREDDAKTARPETKPQKRCVLSQAKRPFLPLEHAHPARYGSGGSETNAATQSPGNRDCSPTDRNATTIRSCPAARSYPPANLRKS